MSTETLCLARISNTLPRKPYCPNIRVETTSMMVTLRLRTIEVRRVLERSRDFWMMVPGAALPADGAKKRLVPYAGERDQGDGGSDREGALLLAALSHVVRVLDADAHAPAHLGRPHGKRVQHLGAKVRQLGGLLQQQQWEVKSSQVRTQQQVDASPAAAAAAGAARSHTSSSSSSGWRADLPHPLPRR